MSAFQFHNLLLTAYEAGVALGVMCAAAAATVVVIFYVPWCAAHFLGWLIDKQKKKK